MPNTYNAQNCNYDFAEHDEKLRNHMNAKKRASNSVIKIATHKGCVKEHKFGPLDAISALRLNVSTIDKRLAAALEDPSREKDGKIFPFVDIIGEDFSSS